MSVYSPYRNENTVVTFYEYRHGHLWQIRRNVLDNPPIAETLRIDQNNSIIFNLRQLTKSNESLSDDDVTRLRFDAKQIEETSDALIAGKIELLQGHWQEGDVTTCAGKQFVGKPFVGKQFVEKPFVGKQWLVGFEPHDQRWLKERQSNSSGPLTIAWLDSPEGKQLLLVANEDFCRWEPTKDKL
ncbi:hypothetical protein Xbed_03395 [Xenorhabdus beddingii]|uniref:Lipoprotein n=2 Tax=Xenorhabdus beddingii TaxID=40578 RepID=A0A1Y2SF54_9GAMM|nr:hypothetical protein Xbed_03395 [Xenorhabdus beddingii]